MRLGQPFCLQWHNRNVEGQVIGIDTYSLENFEGKRVGWKSYTAVSVKQGKWRRFWLTDWRSDGWWLWLSSKRTSVGKDYKLLVKRSGVASLKFSGDAGVSTSAAALLVFTNGKQVYSLERFAGSKLMRFDAFPVKSKLLRY